MLLLALSHLTADFYKQVGYWTVRQEPAAKTCYAEQGRPESFHLLFSMIAKKHLSLRIRNISNKNPTDGPQMALVEMWFSREGKYFPATPPNAAAFPREAYSAQTVPGAELYFFGNQLPLMRSSDTMLIRSRTTGMGLVNVKLRDWNPMLLTLEECANKLAAIAPVAAAPPKSEVTP